MVVCRCSRVRDNLPATLHHRDQDLLICQAQSPPPCQNVIVLQMVQPCSSLFNLVSSPLLFYFLFFFNNLTYWTWDVFKCYKLFNHTNYQQNQILLPWISLLSNHQLLLLKLLHSNFETIIYLNANMSKVETDFNINLLLGFVIVSLMWKKKQHDLLNSIRDRQQLPIMFSLNYDMRGLKTVVTLKQCFCDFLYILKADEKLSNLSPAFWLRPLLLPPDFVHYPAEAQFISNKLFLC